MKLFTQQEKIISLYLIAEVLEFLEESKSIEILKEQLKKKMQEIAVSL